MVFVVVLCAFLAAGAVVALAVAARRTSSVSLAGPFAGPGEMLIVDEGGDQEETVVVRRVLPDLTAAHVVLVRPFRPWHKWMWTRRLL